MKGDNIFDSRFLTFLDGYTVRFTLPGLFQFGIGIGTKTNYEIVVTDSKDKTKKGTTHSVTIHKDPDSKRGFIVKPEHVEILSDDLIMWHFADNDSSIIITVNHNNKKNTTSNQILTKDTIFTHCFIRQGQFSYRNILNPKNDGTILVKSAKGLSREEWMKKIQKPTVVRITEKKIDPQSVSILEGQTLVWLIECDTILQGVKILETKKKKIIIKSKTTYLEIVPRDIEKISQRQVRIILSKLNQNHSEKELAELIEIPDKKDIGIKLARKILEKKKNLGEFKNLSEIDEIEGIGPKRLRDIITSLL